MHGLVSCDVGYVSHLRPSLNRHKQNFVPRKQDHTWSFQTSSQIPQEKRWNERRPSYTLCDVGGAVDAMHFSTNGELSGTQSGQAVLNVFRRHLRRCFHFHRQLEALPGSTQPTNNYTHVTLGGLNFNERKRVCHQWVCVFWLLCLFSCRCLIVGFCICVYK